MHSVCLIFIVAVMCTQKQVAAIDQKINKLWEKLHNHTLHGTLGTYILFEYYILPCLLPFSISAFGSLSDHTNIMWRLKLIAPRY